MGGELMDACKARNEWPEELIFPSVSIVELCQAADGLINTEPAAPTPVSHGQARTKSIPPKPNIPPTDFITAAQQTVQRPQEQLNLSSVKHTPESSSRWHTPR